MADIAIKSTGQLFDELVTNAFKTAHAVDHNRSIREFQERHTALATAITERLRCRILPSSSPPPVRIPALVHEHCLAIYRWKIGPLHSKEIHVALFELCQTSLATWRAQEIVMSDGHHTEIARAAREAQRCNAARAGSIRELDHMFGESEITITSKTYG